MLGNLLRVPNWLPGSGFCRSRCWLGYHNRIGNRLRNIDGFRPGLMSTNRNSQAHQEIVRHSRALKGAKAEVKLYDVVQ